MQPLYRELKEGIESLQFVEGVPTSLDDLKQHIYNYPKSVPKLFVFDDMMNDISSFISEIFTVISHHFNSSVIFLTQSLFYGKKEFRTMSLNAHYLILCKSPRDSSQIIPLARQIRPHDSKLIVSVYKDATKNPYSYLLFDFHQNQQDSVRLRSNIFPSDDTPMIVYLPHQ